MGNLDDRVDEIMRTIDEIEESGNGMDRVDREKIGKSLSQQPRFQNDSPVESFYYSTNYWIKSKKVQLKEVPYSVKSKKRDAWLRDFVKLEPNLNGVLRTVVAIDKNRGWRMVGGRNQVSRFTDMLHGMEAAPGLFGWRSAVEFMSQSFWGADISAIIELGRQGRNGPIRKMYTVDPTKCMLTGNRKTPLAYYPRTGKKQLWRWNDFIRVPSMISTDERYFGLGYCAVSTCVLLAQLMVAVYEHDAEQLAAQAPRGLLILLGITQLQWDQAMRARDEKLKGKGYEYFEALAVIASGGQSIDAKLIALSELPKSFEMRTWMDMLMYGYALAFTYDVSEFWPVQFGALGRGDETRIQHEKATGKGRLDFALSFQEQLQSFLPETLEFLFDQRDDKGDQLNAQKNKAWIEVVNLLDGKISLEQQQVLLAEFGVIPRSWTVGDVADATDQTDSEFDENVSDIPDKVEEPIEVDATGGNGVARSHREMLLENDYVFRAARKFPNEQIVQYNWPTNTVVTLWDSGADLLKPRVWKGVG